MRDLLPMAIAVASIVLVLWLLHYVVQAISPYYRR